MKTQIQQFVESRFFRWCHWLILGSFFSSAVYFFWPQMGDDAYIFFRYARHIANGHGPVWNPHEPPVEGFSSPLWVYWLAGWGRWFDIPMVARASGVLALMGLMVSVYYMSKRSWVSMWGVLLTMGIHYWGTAGLETALVVCLTVGCLPLLTTNTNRWSVMALALLGIARPEGIGLVVLLVGWCWWRDRERVIWLALLPMLGWQLVRWWVYDDVLPNTYWAKATGDRWVQLQSGWNYAGWLGLSIVTGVFTPQRRVWWFPAILWLVVIIGGGDWMWHERLLLPTIVVLWVLSAELRWSQRLWVVVPLMKYWMSFGMLGAIVGVGWTGKRLPIREHQEGNLIEVSENIAKELQAIYPTDTLMAINHAGVLPYFLADYRFVDMSALNDHHLARTAGNLHEKFDPEYILARKPDLVILNSLSDPKTGEGYQDNYWAGESVLFRHPQFVKEYVPIAKSWRRIRYGGDVASIWIFQRRRTLKRWNSE